MKSILLTKQAVADICARLLFGVAINNTVRCHTQAFKIPIGILLFAVQFIIMKPVFAQVNLALGKPITSSSTFDASLFPNSNLTDGNLATSARTNNTLTPPNAEWFEIDLGSDFVIDSIRITNRAASPAYGQRFMLATWSQKIGVSPGSNPSTYLSSGQYNRLIYTDAAAVTAANPFGSAVPGTSGQNLGPAYTTLSLHVGVHLARYIRIINLQDDYLNFNEIEVFAGATPVRAFLNGGFETKPTTSTGTSFVHEGMLPGWSTTEPTAMTSSNPNNVSAGGLIEFWGTTSGVTPYEGSWFVELNAYSNGELSQLTSCILPGESASFSFAHRGRSGVDIMSLRVDEAEVARISDNNAASGTHSFTIIDPATTSLSQGATTANGWTLYSGTWINTSGTPEILKFGFGAFSTSSGNLSVGNFLDAVSFTIIPSTISLDRTIGTGSEASSAGTFPRLWVNGRLDNPETIQLNITGGTAIRGVDYITTPASGPISITIPAGYYDGSTRTSIPLDPYFQIVSDGIEEADETIEIALSNPSSGLKIANTTQCNGTTNGAAIYTIMETPLPVRLLSFNAIPQGCTVLLQWKSGFEQNNEKYLVEHSTDGVVFSGLSSIASQNNPSGAVYSFRDYRGLQSGKKYYRLRMEDLDGYNEPSKVVSAEVFCGTQVNISPNPFKNQVKLSNLPFATTIIVIDQMGRIIYTKSNIQLSEISFDTHKWTKGIYNLILKKEEDAIYKAKLIKL